MTTATPATSLERFCSVCARKAGVATAGSAYSYEHVLAVELPLPWPESMYSEPGILPQELLDLRQLQLDAYYAGRKFSVGALAIAPDAAYSRQGCRRVISYRRPDGAFSSFSQAEYLAPDECYGALCWALLVDKAALPRFDEFRIATANTRDLMVCTHGAVDAACAKFGFPIYRQLRRAAEQMPQIRVWRVSHFGGHVFAPTLLDMPEFRYWGYVERHEAEVLLTRNGDVNAVGACYRGWAGFESPLLQVAERELFLRHGWPWLQYRKSGQVLAQEMSPGAKPGFEPSWAEVEIAYCPLDGAAGSYRARVERNGYIDCIATTGDPTHYPHPQYVVTRLEHVA